MGFANIHRYVMNYEPNPLLVGRKFVKEERFINENKCKYKEYTADTYRNYAITGIRVLPWWRHVERDGI